LKNLKGSFIIKTPEKAQKSARISYFVIDSLSVQNAINAAKIGCIPIIELAV